MENPTVISKEEEESLTVTPLPPTPVCVTMKPCLSNEEGAENQAVVMTSNEAMLAVSPTEASPANPTIALPTLTVTMGDTEAIPANPSIAIPTVTMGDTEAIPANPSIAIPTVTMGDTEASQANPTIALPTLTVAMGDTEASPANPAVVSASPATCNPDPRGLLEDALSAVRTCGEVCVTLENNSVWREFYHCGTEMILTKPGRRMFPYCRYRLTGLEPTRSYTLVLSITPADAYRYRWNGTHWENSGPGDPHIQDLSRVFPHQDSPALGIQWMASLVSFYKLKLTNNFLDQEGRVLLHSMHRYRPRLHVIPIANVGDPEPNPKHFQLNGHEVMTFTFPQTDFYAVTSYQNIRITQLKIDYNPFARGFREDATNQRLAKPRSEQPQKGRTDTHSPGLNSARPSGSEQLEQMKDRTQTVTDCVSANEEKNKDLSMKRSLPATLSEEGENEVQPKLRRVASSTVLPADSETLPITDASASEEGVDLDNSDSEHVFHKQYLRAQLALPSVPASLTAPPSQDSTRLHKTSAPPVVNVTNSSEPLPVEVLSSRKVPLPEPIVTSRIPLPKPQENAACVTSKMPQPRRIMPRPSPPIPTPSPPTPTLSPVSFAVPKSWKKGKTRKRRGNGWYIPRPVLSPIPATSSPATVTMQPELDDVEGLLFVSFTSKEALGLLVDDIPPSVTPLVSPVPQKTAAVEVTETDEEKIARLQTVLLQDLNRLKHRQVIHLVLQEVGLKLSSLDPSLAIDLQYLGVCLPLPPPVFVGLGNATALMVPTDGVPFLSRTGKTSDLTKIKGWRDKFNKKKESSTHDKGVLKNRSAFCSDMLDEYLESEAQKISDRADAFSLNPLGSVAYQLPAKSTSYVRTLDSVLKTRAPPPQPPSWGCRPCPLSRKPLLYAALTQPPPPFANSKVSPKTAKSKAKKHHTPPQGKSKPAPVLRPIQMPSSNKATGAARPSAGPKATHIPSPGVQRSPPGKMAVRRDSSPVSSQGQGVSAHRLPGLSKSQLRLIEMEEGAVNQGHEKTHITPERIEMALAALLTAQGLPKNPVLPVDPVEGPECCQQFCRLGCVCASLARRSRGPLHCRRTECMLGCGCFKRKIIKQMTVVEDGNQMLPVYTVSNLEHQVQPDPGSHLSSLWDRTSGGVDPEPLFIPKSAPIVPKKLSPPMRRYNPRLHPQIPEEDKDPIYKYFESMMTCARVRGFNCQPPPQLQLFNHNNSSTPSSGKMLKNTPGLTSAVYKSEGKCPPQARSKGSEPSRLLNIQSDCNWDQHRKLVIGVLCRRMSQNRLTPPFNIGPYHIRLLSEIHARKAEGLTITFKIRISQTVVDKTDEEEVDDDDTDDDDDEEEDDEEVCSSKIEESELQVGVTPFLTGVVPAGRLLARRKQPGRPALGLIQVNGKSYSQARLLLGQMGALHPANRLAAFVTGRLRSLTKAPPTGAPKATSFPRPRPPPPGPPRPPQAGNKAVAHRPTEKGKLPHTTPTAPTPANPQDPARSRSRLLLMPVSPTAASDASPGPPLPVMPPVGKKMVLQPVPTPQGSKFYRQSNGQLIQLVPVRQIQPKTGAKDPGLATPPSQPPTTSIRPPCSPPPIGPLVKFITGKSGTITPSQTSSSSSSSPLSLTISSSLKTPSFLGERGTYSFRICPPPADQVSKGSGQTTGSPSGVALPGGFTLIQLPKPGAPQPPKPNKTTNGTGGEKSPKCQNLSSSSPSATATITDTAQPEVVCSDHSYTGTTLAHSSISDSRSAPTNTKKSPTQSRAITADSESVQPHSSGPMEPNELTCDEKMPSDESDAERGEVSQPRRSEPLGESTEFTQYVTEQKQEDLRGVNSEVSQWTSNGTREDESDSDSDDMTDDTSESDSVSDEDVRNTDEGCCEEETVDIETVEETRQRITIAKMRAAVETETETQDTTQDSETTQKPKVGHHKRVKGEREDGSGEDGGRRNHTVTERLRRYEHRKLFSKLRDVLFLKEMVPGVSKLHILSQALKEIRTLVVQSDSLEEKKRMLTQMQSTHVKDIARLSGNPEELIKTMLRGLCERQNTLAVRKMEGSPLSTNTLLSGQAVSGVPLIRTKTGRVILPASLKPANQCMQPIYTVKVMNVTVRPRPISSKQREEKEEVTSAPTPSQLPDPQPSDPKKDQDTVCTEPEQPSDSPGEERPEGGKGEEKALVCNGSAEEKEKPSTTIDKTAKPQNSVKGRLERTTQRVAISRRNSTTWRPPVESQKVAGGETGGRVLALSKGEAALLVQAPSEDKGNMGREGKDNSAQQEDNDGSKAKDGSLDKPIKKAVVVSKLEKKPNDRNSSPLSPSASASVTPKRPSLLRTLAPSTEESPVTPAEDSPVTPVPRRRGRPRKRIEESPVTPSEGSLAEQQKALVTPVPRPRGRPRKSIVNTEVTPVGGHSLLTKTGGSPGTQAGGSLARVTRTGNSPARGAGGSPAKVCRVGDSPIRRAGDTPAQVGRYLVSPVTRPVTRAATGTSVKRTYRLDED